MLWSTFRCTATHCHQYRQYSIGLQYIHVVISTFLTPTVQHSSFWRRQCDSLWQIWLLSLPCYRLSWIRFTYSFTSCHKLTCSKFEFSELRVILRFGIQQRLNEWRQTRRPTYCQRYRLTHWMKRWNLIPYSFLTTVLLTSIIDFKISALVVEQFWHVCWISYCEKLSQQMWHFYIFLLQIHSNNCLQKLTY